LPYAHAIPVTMASPEYGSLSVGIHVDIQRTDGRIHQAVVTGLAPETSSVTVEWYEKGETKGKEVELEMIQVNSEIRGTMLKKNITN
jgi:hypothetical protein